MVYKDINTIEKLIAAFYEGQTTPQEEKILYDFFSQEDIPGHLLEDKVFFREIGSLQIQEIPPELEKSIDTLIDNLEKDEKRSIPLEQPSKSNIKRINWTWVSGIAASLFIILSISIFTYNQEISHKNMVIADTFSDPKEAYLETEKALLYVSNKLNKGFEQVESLQKNMDKTNKIIEKNIRL